MAIIDKEQYLLSVGRADSLDKINRPINGTYITPPVNSIIGTQYASLTCEHKRVIYILTHIGETVRLQKLNMLNNILSWICDFTWSTFNRTYFGDIKVDDKYMYIKSSNNSNTPLYIVELTSKQLIAYNMTKITYDYGQLSWFNNRTLIMQVDSGGYALFDTKTKSFTYITSQTTNYNRGAFSHNGNIILSTYYTNSNVIYKHDFSNNTYSTITLSVSSITKTCYCEDDKLFYIVQTAKLYTWDPVRETLSSPIVMPWGAPAEVIVKNGMLYMTQSNSNIAYMYDINKRKYWMIILPFNYVAMNYSINNMNRMTVSNGYWFIPNETMYQIHYTINDKYKLGNKYDRLVFLFDESQESSFDFDNRFVSFNSSYLTIHDGSINKPLKKVSSGNNIKKITVNKNEYNKLKNISFIR